MEVALANRKKAMIVVLAMTAVAVQGVAMRVRAHSSFRVQPPMAIGAWNVKSIPLSSEAMSALGNPQADGWSYSNALDESVTVQVISPDTFDAYRNPPILTRFFTAVSATEIRSKAGGMQQTTFTALADAESKIVMMTWIQQKSGRCKPISSSGEQSLVDRLRINVETLLQPEPYCLVRVYLAIPKWDVNGQQSKHTVTRVANAIQSAGGNQR
jgi:hypothetical protein